MTAARNNLGNFYYSELKWYYRNFNFLKSAVMSILQNLYFTVCDKLLADISEGAFHK